MTKKKSPLNISTNRYTLYFKDVSLLEWLKESADKDGRSITSYAMRMFEKERGQSK